MDLGLKEDFVDLSSKAKINEWDCIKAQASAQPKKPSTKSKHSQQKERCLQTTPLIRG